MRDPTMGAYSANPVGSPNFTAGYQGAALKLGTHTYPFNGPLSGTIWVSWYQKGKTNQDFIETTESEWQWHQLGHMQVCTSLQTDNHASNSPQVFLHALADAQPTASKQ